jgi:ubiquitin-conjugating enzyme E2 O
MIVHDNSRRLREGSKRFALKQNNNFVIEQPVRFEDLSAACIKYDGTHSVTKSDGSSHINHIRRIPRTSTLGYDVNVFSVCNTDTRVTIRWQDASITTHSSTEVIPDLDVDNEVELFPGDIVIPTPSGVNGIVDRTSWRPSKIGVVQSVTASERLAQVLWQPAADVEYVQDSVSGTSWVKGGSFTGFPVRSSPDGPGILEDVTIYSVVPAPNLDRKIGDFVLTSIGLWGAADFGRFGLVGEFAPNPKTDWFGEVIDITLDGLLVLRIVTDDDSEAREVRIAPELTIVALSVTDAVSETDSDYDSGNGSHSTNPGEMWVENDDGERVAYTQGEDADWATEASDDNNPPSSLPPPHQGETTQDSQQAAVSNSPDGTASSSSDGTASSSPDCTASSSSDGTASSSPGGTVSRSPLKAAARIVGGADAMHVDSSPTAAAARPIPRPASFEVLDGAPSSNHRFVSSAPCEHSSQFLRRIQKEHGILASSLPEGVFVRTWESRLDLLRALIVGPADTPYEFAPFVIDIRLPPGYPNLPPQAFFYSHTDGSGPINPNLYEDGKICLSLLNT